MTNKELLEQYGPRESMDYDVVIVGAGPAGLATAIHLKREAQEKGQEVSICVLEKGSEPGAHELGGSVFDQAVLDELIPDWRQKDAPLHQPVLYNHVLLLSEKVSVGLPALVTPRNLRNEGCYIISQGNLVKWLVQQAEELEIDIFSGFAAAQVLYDDEKKKVLGVITGDMGLDKNQEPKGSFQLGMELRGKYTVFAEGSRGHLGRQLIEHFKLDAKSDAQSYSIGVKELWEVSDAQHRPGTVIQTAGWPLDDKTYGGGFIYHMEGNKVALGLVIGLDYTNPWIDPFEEMQRWKTHPDVRRSIEGGKRMGYGARTITAGGLFSLPQCHFPGGVLVGCEAGFLNGSRIKGLHTAMKSGMLAAQSILDALQKREYHANLSSFDRLFKQSWMYTELQQSKNFKQWFAQGLYVGSIMTGVENLALPLIGVRNPPWTRRSKMKGYQATRPAAEMPRIHYPAPDGKLTFDKLSSLYLSNTYHEENQPCHLKLKDPDLAVKVNLKVYAGLEERYCPAGVYEFVQKEGVEPYLQINASNCIHCKTCDIKDPRQNIVWDVPEGGGGPNYKDM